MPQQSDQEIQQTRLLVEFYEQLTEIESAFAQAEEVIQTKFAIANNFDLENPDTYLALITPVSRKIKYIANLSKLARYKLIEYRRLESNPTSEQLSTPKSANLPEQPTQTFSKSLLEMKFELLKQRVERLELIVSLSLGVILGSLLVWVLFYI